MIRTVLITTSPSQRRAVERLSRDPEFRVPELRWFHLSFDGGPVGALQAPDDTVTFEPGTCRDLPVDPSLTLDVIPDPQAEPLASQGPALLYALEQWIRLATLDGSAGPPGDLAHVLVLGTVTDHGSNQLTLHGLRAALEARRMLAGQPDLRVDLLLAQPLQSFAVGPEQQEISLRMLEALEPMQQTASRQEAWFGFRSTVLVDETAGTGGGDEPDPLICDAIATWIQGAEHIEARQTAAASAGGGRHLARCGVSVAAYKPGDLLEAIVDAEGPDFRERLLLRGLDEGGAVPGRLRDHWGSLRASVETEIERTIDDHVRSVAAAPRISAAPIPPPSAGAEEVAAALKTWVDDPPEVEQVLTPLPPETADTFGGWLADRLGDLVDRHGFSLPEVGLFARGLVDGPVPGLDAFDGKDEHGGADLVDEYLKRRLAICRGDLVGTIDELVEDPELRRSFLDNEELDDRAERILSSEDPAVAMRMPMAMAIGGHYQEEEEVLEWSAEQVRRFPERLLEQLERLRPRLEALDQEIEDARPRAEKFFAKRTDKEALAERIEERRRVEADHLDRICALAGTHVDRLERCAQRAHALGAWRTLRLRILRDVGEVLEGIGRVGEAFARVYEDTTDLQAAATHVTALGERIAGDPRFSSTALGPQVDDAERQLRDSGANFVRGRTLLTCDEEDLPAVPDLLPPEISEIIPWDLSSALSPSPGSSDAFADLMEELARRAFDQAGLDPTVGSADQPPVVLPLLSCDENSPIVDFLRSNSTFLSFLWGRLDPWRFLATADARLELRLLSLDVPLTGLLRHGAMRTAAREHGDRAARTGREVVEYAGIYRGILSFPA